MDNYNFQLGFDKCLLWIRLLINISEFRGRLGFSGLLDIGYILITTLKYARNVRTIVASRASYND